MDNLNNKCALTPHECVKKVVLDFQQPVAPTLSVSYWEKNWSMI